MLSIDMHCSGRRCGPEPYLLVSSIVVYYYPYSIGNASPLAKVANLL